MHAIAIITAFGIGAAVTGLASAVYALPTAQSQAETGVTLSGDSLRGLETRNADKDFSSFFTGSSLNFLSGNSNILTAPNQQGSPLGNLEFRGGSLDNGNNNDPARFPTADSDRQFGVRYRLLDEK